MTNAPSAPTHLPRVYVVDDDPAVLKSVAFLISILEVETCPLASAEAFLSAYRPGVPSCLVLDVRMPGMSGMELQEVLRRRHIDIPIIFVSGHGDIPMTVRAIRGGAVNFLTKPYSDQDLLDSVQKAIRADRLRQQERREAATLLARFDLLTHREQEVLSLIVQGFTNKQIAQTLDISVKTVETHRARVMEKMRADNLAELFVAHQTVLRNRSQNDNEESG